MLFEIILVLVVSGIASLAVTPGVIVLATRLNAVDLPDRRKMHLRPVPLLGGVGVVLAAVVSLTVVPAALWPVRTPPALDLGSLLPLCLGTSLVLSIGVVDDLRPLTARTKVLFQGLAAVLVVALGVTIDRLTFFGAGAMELGLWSYPVTIAWIVVVTNAFNLVDGLDGLAAGQGSIAAAALAGVFFLAGNSSDGLVLTALCGALLGFLLYNFNPARVFLGDSGSLPLGFILAVTTVHGFQGSGGSLPVVIVMLALGLPVLETFLSAVRRFNGQRQLSLQWFTTPIREQMLFVRRMFLPDMEHVHHRLIHRGMSHRGAVVTLYVASMALAMMGLALYLAEFRNAVLVCGFAALGIYVALVGLGYAPVPLVRHSFFVRAYQWLAAHRYSLPVLDTLVFSGAYWGAFLLKYAPQWEPGVLRWHAGIFPAALLIHQLLYWALGLYTQLRHVTHAVDALKVPVRLLISSCATYAVVVVYTPPAEVLSFAVIQVFLGLPFALAIRSTDQLRVMLEYFQDREEIRGDGTLIYGADPQGRLVVHAMRGEEDLGLHPIGFIDDDPSRRGRELDRVPVLGSGAELASILSQSPATVLIISSRDVNGDQLQSILNLCRRHRVRVIQAQLQLATVPLEGESEELKALLKQEMATTQLQS